MQPFDVTPSAPQNMHSRGPITVRDMSDADLGRAMPEVTATGGVLVKFFHTRVKIKTRNATENARFENRLCVAKQPKSDRATVATCFITEEQARRQFPREYEYFTKNEDLPTDGTPLNELPGITQSQLGLLILSGLRSVEDLVAVDDDSVREIGFEAIQAQKVARKWVAAKEGAADQIAVADVEARYQSQIDAQTQREKSLKDRIKELEFQMQAMSKMGGAAPAVQAQQAAAPASSEPMAFTGGDDLPDIDSMPNPLADGPGEIDLPDPLRMDDDD